MTVRARTGQVIELGKRLVGEIQKVYRFCGVRSIIVIKTVNKTIKPETQTPTCSTGEFFLTQFIYITIAIFIHSPILFASSPSSVTLLAWPNYPKIAKSVR